MKKLFMLAPIFITLGVSSAYAVEPVTADFINSKGEKIGTVTLKTIETGTLITVDVQLPEGAHAIHIHEDAQCAAPDFKTAGGHFNPGHDKNGFTGDLPNLYVEPSGHIKTEIFSNNLHLSGKESLMHGTSIIIHEKGDDFGISAAAAPVRR